MGRRVDFTKETKEQILKLYNEGLGCAKIGSIIQPNCSRTPIERFLSEEGIELKNTNPRKYTCNEDFFKVVDTEEKAYWLGFIYADGCVHRNTLQVSQSIRDIEHLEKLNNSLNGSYSVKSFVQDSWGTQTEMALLAINSKKMVSNLHELGCVPKKSLILEFPTENQVPSHLIRHFIRGYFDGDGSISQTDGKWWTFSVLGTYSIIEGIKNTLEIQAKVSRETRVENLYKLCIGGNLQVLEKSSYLYEDDTVYLDRKHSKYLQLKNLYSEELIETRKRLSSRFR